MTRTTCTCTSCSDQETVIIMNSIANRIYLFAEERYKNFRYEKKMKINNEVTKFNWLTLSYLYKIANSYYRMMFEHSSGNTYYLAKERLDDSSVKHHKYENKWLDKHKKKHSVSDPKNNEGSRFAYGLAADEILKIGIDQMFDLKWDRAHQCFREAAKLKFAYENGHYDMSIINMDEDQFQEYVLNMRH